MESTLQLTCDTIYKMHCYVQAACQRLQFVVFDASNRSMDLCLISERYNMLKSLLYVTNLLGYHLTELYIHLYQTLPLLEVLVS